VMSRAALSLTCIAFAARAPLTRAQTPATSTTPTPTLSTSTTLVVVPALVRDKSGQLIFTLKAADFTLTDDGVPQKLTLEQDTGGEPLALVVVIQGGGIGEREIEKVHALSPLIESVVGNVPHRVAVVGFDSAPVLIQDFTPNIDRAADAVEELIADHGGDDGAAIVDSVGFSVDLLRKQPPQYRRVILLVSETIDHGSKLKLQEALRAISDTNTAVYSIALSTGRTGMKETWSSLAAAPPSNALSFMPEIALAAAAITMAIDGLRRNTPETIARLTGGEYLEYGNSKGLARDLQTVANHIPNRYILSFQPQSPRPGFHAISLKTPAYGFEVTARTGYWADTPSPTTSLPATPH
jgi:VWFA-related protein